MATKAELEQAQLKKQKKKLEDEIKKLRGSSYRSGGVTPERAAQERRMSELSKQLSEVNRRLGSSESLPIVETLPTATGYGGNKPQTPDPKRVSKLESMRVEYQNELRKALQQKGGSVAQKAEREKRIASLRSSISRVNFELNQPVSADEVLPTGGGFRSVVNDVLTSGEVLPTGGGYQSADAAAQMVRMRQNQFGWTQEQQLMRDQLKKIFLSNEIGTVDFQTTGDSEAARTMADSKGGVNNLTPQDFRNLLTPEVRPEFEGYTFGPKQDLTSDARFFAPSGATRDVNVMDGMSVKNIYAMFYDLNETELVTFQKELMNAGLFGENRPRLGQRDPETRLALERLMQIWGGSAPDKPVGELLTELKRNKTKKQRDAINELLGVNTAAQSPIEVALTSKERLGMMIDEVAVDLFGSGIDPARREELISRYQAKEREQQLAMATRAAKAQSRSQIPDFDLFVDALIGQDSGETLAQNWDRWARDAGISPTDMSAETQRRVVEFQVAKMYSDWGNWDDVASSWASGQNSQDYADNVRARMEELRRQQMGGGPAVYEYEKFDPTAVAYEELRAADPARYIATQFRRQADVFFGMLGGIRR